MLAERQFLRHCPWLMAQGNALLIARQAIKIRAVKTGECFQSIERAGLLEYFRVKLDGRVRRIAAGAAATRFLAVPRVRRAVAAEKESGIARRGGSHQRDAMLLPFQDRKAIIVGPHAAGG